MQEVKLLSARVAVLQQIEKGNNNKNSNKSYIKDAKKISETYTKEKTTTTNNQTTKKQQH